MNGDPKPLETKLSSRGSKDQPMDGEGLERRRTGALALDMLSNITRAASAIKIDEKFRFVLQHSCPLILGVTSS